MIRGDTVLFVFAVVGLTVGILLGYNWTSLISSLKGGKDA